MARALAAGALYFAILFAIGFVLGTLRVLVLAPRLGETPATLLELPVMLALSVFVALRLARRLAVPPAGAPRLAMGGSALLLLWTAETVLGLLLFGRTPAEQAAAMTSGAGLAGTLAQLAFGLIPWAAGRLAPAPSARR